MFVRFCMFARSLFTLSIRTKWWRDFVFSSMASLHPMRNLW